MKCKVISLFIALCLCIGLGACVLPKPVETEPPLDYEEYCIIFGSYVLLDGKYMRVQTNAIQPPVLETIYIDNEGDTFYFDDGGGRVYVKDTYIDIAGNPHTIYNNIERVGEGLVKE